MARAWADGFEEAGQDAMALRRVLCRYLKLGAAFRDHELVEALDQVFDAAEMSDDDALAVMRILATSKPRQISAA